MTLHLHAKIFLFFIMVLSIKSALASNGASTYQKLTMHGDSYENSCSIKRKQELMIKIQKNALHHSQALQNAIKFILCGNDTPQDINRMVSIIDEVVTMTYEGTGEEKKLGTSREKTEILKEIMAKGKAWNATLNFEDSEAKLQYFSSEACVESVKLRHSEKSWLVYEIGGACD